MKQTGWSEVPQACPREAGRWTERPGVPSSSNLFHLANYPLLATAQKTDKQVYKESITVSVLSH